MKLFLIVVGLFVVVAEPDETGTMTRPAHIVMFDTQEKVLSNGAKVPPHDTVIEFRAEAVIRGNHREERNAVYKKTTLNGEYFEITKPGDTRFDTKRYENEIIMMSELLGAGGARIREECIERSHQKRCLDLGDVRRKPLTTAVVSVSGGALKPINWHVGAGAPVRPRQHRWKFRTLSSSSSEPARPGLEKVGLMNAVVFELDLGEARNFELKMNDEVYVLTNEYDSPRCAELMGASENQADCILVMLSNTTDPHDSTSPNAGIPAAQDPHRNYDTHFELTYKLLKPTARDTEDFEDWFVPFIWQEDASAGENPPRRECTPPIVEYP